MANVLQTIVADKKVEIANREQSFPPEQFKNDLVPSAKSLFDALNKDRVGFIFECKKASPSKGLIREHFDLDEILAAYTPYAAGISVLTDEKYFQGTFEYLQYVTERSPVPVLNKDFFVAPYQVYLARHYNADAILLMLSVLDDQEYRELAQVADSLSLDILTEVSNEEEMVRAISLQAKIIGINNRNLRDLSTDLATTERLVPMLANTEHAYVVISESGIYTHSDVQRLAPLSHGFLVGSALMAQEDLNHAVKSLVYGETKVCGLTRAEDAANALDAGACFLGLIFVPASPRYMELEQAKALTTATKGKYVGVFKDAEIESIVEYCNALDLHAVQLHGSESAQFRATLRQKLPETTQIWQAVPLAQNPSSEQLDLAGSTLADEHCDKVLFDCKVGEQVGGTGKAFDWTSLNDLPNKHKWILAGGIGEHNIAYADALKPSIVDINSCVETAPGVKDGNAIINTIEQRRSLSVDGRANTKK